MGGGGLAERIFLGEGGGLEGLICSIFPALNNLSILSPEERFLVPKGFGSIENLETVPTYVQISGRKQRPVHKI